MENIKYYIGILLMGVLMFGSPIVFALSLKEAIKKKQQIQSLEKQKLELEIKQLKDKR